jgi:lipopolysaccharide export system permease protein
VRDDAGAVKLQRFVNIGRIRASGEFADVRVFEFDDSLRLQRIVHAPTAGFVGTDLWQLEGATELAIHADVEVRGSNAIRVQRESRGQMAWHTRLTPEILNVLAVSPESMSAWGLYAYIGHLRANRQDPTRYEIAMWKKIIYPLAVLVMMALALPFAYLHARAGSIGYKVFAGIMLGVAFHFLNGLFSHLGLLNTWAPWIAVSIPSIAALLIALFMLYRVGGAR